jgi:hypothetical protein
LEEREAMVKQQVEEFNAELVQTAKACPFCDSKNLGMLSVPEVTKSGSTRTWFIYCKHCKADGPQDPSPQHAVVRWNDRIPTPPRPPMHIPKMLILFALLALLGGCAWGWL